MSRAVVMAVESERSRIAQAERDAEVARIDAERVRLEASCANRAAELESRERDLDRRERERLQSLEVRAAALVAEQQLQSVRERWSRVRRGMQLFAQKIKLQVLCIWLCECSRGVHD